MSTQMLNMLFYYKIMNVAVGKLKTVFEINGTSLPLVAPRRGAGAANADKGICLKKRFISICLNTIWII